MWGAGLLLRQLLLGKNPLSPGRHRLQHSSAGLGGLPRVSKRPLVCLCLPADINVLLTPASCRAEHQPQARTFSLAFPLRKCLNSPGQGPVTLVTSWPSAEVWSLSCEPDFSQSVPSNTMASNLDICLLQWVETSFQY